MSFGLDVVLSRLLLGWPKPVLTERKTGFSKGFSVVETSLFLCSSHFKMLEGIAESDVGVDSAKVVAMPGSALKNCPKGRRPKWKIVPILLYEVA